MRRGTKPMPAALAKAQGYKRKKNRTAPGKEPVARVGTPDLPASVRSDAVALDCWKRMRAHLLKLKVLTKADGAALEALCVAYSRAYHADATLRQHGTYQQNLYGAYVVHPAVKVSYNAWAQVVKFAAEFGLTPSSRTNVREIPDTHEDSGDESPEEFLFAKNKIAGHIGTA